MTFYPVDARLRHCQVDGDARLRRSLATQPLVTARGTTGRRKTFENIDLRPGLLDVALGLVGPATTVARVRPATPAPASYGLIEWLPEVAEGDLPVSLSALFIPLP
jgi:hypothetical protein